MVGYTVWELWKSANSVPPAIQSECNQLFTDDPKLGMALRLQQVHSVSAMVLANKRFNGSNHDSNQGNQLQHKELGAWSDVQCVGTRCWGEYDQWLCDAPIQNK